MGAILSAIASLVSSSQQSSAAADAVNRLSPFSNAGVRGNSALQQALGLQPVGPLPNGMTPAFKTSPGYQFQMQQGIDAIDNSAAARGGVASGNNLKALESFGEGLANQDFQQYLANLAQLSGLGENAAAGQGNFITQGGNARAAGTVGAANSLAAPFFLSQFQNNPGSIASGFDFSQNPGLYPPAATEGFGFFE